MTQFHLLYEKIDGRGERIRTSGLLLPKQARYRAALRPDVSHINIAPSAGAGDISGILLIYTLRQQRQTVERGHV